MMTKASDFAYILIKARGYHRVVEIGTNIATTAIGLALDDDRREIWTYDPFPRDVVPFTSLVPPRVTDRIRFVPERGDAPSDPPSDVGFLFIDASHERADVVAEFNTWLPRLRPGALVLFHDYSPSFPDVVAAVDVDLRLKGEVHGDVFVWLKP